MFNLTKAQSCIAKTKATKLFLILILIPFGKTKIRRISICAAIASLAEDVPTFDFTRAKKFVTKDLGGETVKNRSTHIKQWLSQEFQWPL